MRGNNSLQDAPGLFAHPAAGIFNDWPDLEKAVIERTFRPTKTILPSGSEIATSTSSCFPAW